MSGGSSDPTEETSADRPIGSPTASGRSASEAESRCRKFGLGDAMILVAAVAVGLALMQLPLHYLLANLRDIVFVDKTVLPHDKVTGRVDWPIILQIYIPTILMFACLTVEALLIPASLAFLIVRLRKPRPPLRTLARQPGVVAHEALLAIVGVVVILSVLGYLPPFSSSFVQGYAHVVRVLVLLAAVCAIPGTWICLALSKKWSSERGWIDLLGRILGLCWAIAMVVHLGTSSN